MGTRYRRLEAWFDDHPATSFFFLATVPGLAFAASQLWLSDVGVDGAAILGVVFGLTFASVTVVGRRILDR